MGFAASGDVLADATRAKDERQLEKILPWRLLMSRGSHEMNSVMSSDERIVAEFQSAMKLKESGDMEAAADKLMDACTPPSIYKAHYRELFKILAFVK